MVICFKLFYSSTALLAFVSTITKCGGFNSILDNGARNACWYFLTPSLRLSKPQRCHQETPTTIVLNNYRNIHKRSDLSLQHFTQKYSGYRYLYFPKGGQGLRVQHRINMITYLHSEPQFMTGVKMVYQGQWAHIWANLKERRKTKNKRMFLSGAGMF